MRKSKSYKHSLPLYGPLNIEDEKQFLEEQKIIFHKCYSVPCPFNVKLEKFTPFGVLGEGGFGKVILVQNKRHLDSFYAMKVMSKKVIVEKDFLKFALNEKRVLQGLNFPFCVRLENMSQDKVNLYYFLPFISSGEMFTHLRKFKKFDEAMSTFYAAQIVLAFEYLHFCDLVYRDLKPENVLIDHFGFIKITDFGFAKIVPTRTYTFCGTPEYIAPEILLGLGHGKAVDYWSLGVLIFEMSSGRTPFVGSDDMATFTNIASVTYQMPSSFSGHLSDLITHLLQEDTTLRYGNLLRGAEDIKNHPWFRRIDWLKLLNRNVTPPYMPDKAEELTAHFPQSKRISSFSEITSSERSSSVSDYDEYFKDF